MLRGVLLLLALAAPIYAGFDWAEIDLTAYVVAPSAPVFLFEVAALCMGVLAGFSILRWLKDVKRITLIGGLMWLFAAIVANLYQSNDFASSVPLFFVSLIHLLFASVFFFLMIERWRSARLNFFISIVVGSILFAVLLRIYVLVSTNDDSVAWDTIRFGTTNVRHISYYALSLLGPGFGFIAVGNRPLRVLGALAVFIGAVLVLWTGGRAGLLAAIIAGAAVFAICTPQKRSKYLFLSSMSLLAALPTSFLQVPHETWGPERIFSSTFAGPTDVNSLTSSRLELWHETAEKVLERPFFGHGQGQFKETIHASRGYLAQPHNSILQFLFEWGIIGAVGIWLMIASAFTNIRNKLRYDQKIVIPATSTFSAFASMSLVDGAFHYVYPVWISVISLALIASSNSSSPKIGGGNARGKEFTEH